MSQDFSAALTDAQSGALPDVLGLQWLEAAPGRVKGRFDVQKSATWRQTASCTPPA